MMCCRISVQSESNFENCLCNHRRVGFLDKVWVLLMLDEKLLVIVCLVAVLMIHHEWLVLRMLYFDGIFY